ncbi:MAG: cytochrome ubiquinol oxidase subunit I [Candidatus Micrarchaeota archaeon]|nr:cytochrome ubiquinol oxidase subunit I [Candidatus Micrarchaeota archaeon]
MLAPIIFDRATMGFALSVHIVLAVIGITLPVIIAVCEYLAARRDDNDYKVMARRLSVMLVILFAAGTASGVLVAVNLLFLWPAFMSLAGSVAILPVYIEVFAFFGEAIFLAMYFYGRGGFSNKYAPAAVMAVAGFFGILSAMLITMLNAFMNTPAGFDIPQYLSTGVLSGINPLAVFNTPSTWIEVAHVVATSYFAGAFIFVAYFAYRLLKTDKDVLKRYFRKGLKISLAIAFVATIASLYTGILSIATLSTLQPEKYAAIELDLVPQSHAPEYIGGIITNNTVVGAIPIPNLQSILDTGSPSGSVPGLSQFPQSTWPTTYVHLMFDAMVGVGFLIGIFLALLLLVRVVLRKDVLKSRLMLLLMIVSGILSVFLLEDGWIMSELARQPWIIYNVMTVVQAGNPSSSIVPLSIGIVVFYIVIIPLTLLVIKKIGKNVALEDELK